VLAALVHAAPKPITPDPNGQKNVGNGAGLQFITGACLSTADCAQTAVQSCCAFIAGGAATGICSGIAVGNANGKAGCGFGDGGAPSSELTVVPVQDEPPLTVVPVYDAAPVMGVATGDSDGDEAGGPAVQPLNPACGVDESLPGAGNVGFALGNQFITGQCFQQRDCASGCCVAQPGGVSVCKARLVTEQAGLSCDFKCV